MRLQVKKGQYTGDGVNDNQIDLGFRPKHVMIYNVDDGDVRVELFDDNADGYANKIVGAAGPATISANAPKIGNRGFNTGTDADVIENLKQYRWIAWG